MLFFNEVLTKLADTLLVDKLCMTQRWDHYFIPISHSSGISKIYVSNNIINIMHMSFVQQCTIYSLLLNFMLQKHLIKSGTIR